jgi:hypothetical protein
MGSLGDIPGWLGTAIFGVVTGVVGFFGKNIWDWWRKRYESQQARQARLEKLQRLLDESGNLFRSQRAQAQRLFESIQRSQPEVINSGLSLDQVFSRAFAKLSSDELQLHTIIRGVTNTSLRRVNVEMADWLRADDWFKQPQPGSEHLSDLARRLQQLELHLNEWHAKLSSVFERDPTLALNYLADEQKHGTGFPTGIEDAVRRVLREL